MKKLTFLFLIGLIGCTNQNSKQEGKNISIFGNKHIENIQHNLVPAHYLQGRSNAKSIPQMMKENNIPAVSIVFIDHGKISWQITFGYANLQDSIKVSPNTVFNGASLSKPVSAMAALKLVDKEILALNEDVNHKLQGWKIPESHFTKKEKVSLKRLISHTAGIDNHLWSSYGNDEKVPSLIEMLTGENPSVDPPVAVVSVPGEKRKYSNPGYSIIEKLIQDATQKEFEFAIDELIFEPCGMDNSSFEQPVPDQMKMFMATGYTNDLNPYPYKLFPFKAAGGIWTTPTDLGKFLMALMDDYHSGKNVILSKKMADSVFQKSPERLGFSKLYDDKSNELLFEHWGSNSGFTSYMVASLKNFIHFWNSLCSVLQAIWLLR
ncbi:MAG TPA: penicillin-binding protein [Bacteroidales bacterium]|nr:penicillin-binding protein [Bacteroidales bacterium]